MSGIPDISHPTGLIPKKKFFADVGETCINMDGCIELARTIDTPQAKAIYRAFRKRLAEFRMSRRDLSQEKMREEAFLTALDDLGFNVSFKPVNGTMK